MLRREEIVARPTIALRLQHDRLSILFAAWGAIRDTEVRPQSARRARLERLEQEPCSGCGGNRELYQIGQGSAGRDVDEYNLQITVRQRRILSARTS